MIRKFDSGEGESQIGTALSLTTATMRTIFKFILSSFLVSTVKSSILALLWLKILNNILFKIASSFPSARYFLQNESLYKTSLVQDST